MNNDGRKHELVNQAIEDFGGLLQDYRRKYFLTLEDMASLVGCSASYIHRIEHGKRNPEIDFRIKVLTMGMNWSTERVYLFLEEVIYREQKRKAE
ncbi:transcriptional regulator, y4mF family [Oceanobacillus picturae]|uniref:Transcriptional regulator, y4mF family n=1 Tax=Oceanobacillus picturae TaxID=171693 RepID=W9ANS4_9BACI|nr:helix-turn-helix transcriptional regulator [Oceanobacillus picturae]CDO04286.1 transcriptional regulator, y4mF family [Oceanobacillus picturae]